MDHGKPPVLSSSVLPNLASSVTEATAEECEGGRSARERVEEWRVLIHHFWKPLVSTLQPLPLFLKAKFCDPRSEALQGQLLDLHIQSRSREASEKLLNWLLDDQDNAPHDLLARWRLFKTALKEVHPILHEVVFDNIYDQDILQHQLNLLNFFMENIAEQVNPMLLLPSLYSRKLMNVENCEHLRALNERHGQTLSAIYMVCNIHRLQSDWYEVFLELLVEKDHGELVKDIDDKVYDKIMAKKGNAPESETSCAEEEALLEVKEPAYEGRPKYYAAAPLAEGRDGGEAGRQREGTELDAEETERKYVLSSAPPKWSVRTTEGESDVEGDEDEFHSCDEGEEVPDFTQLKIRMAWNDPGCRDRGGNQPGQQVWENQESTPGRKEFREKNILPMDEMASSVDNSNEEWVDPAALEEVKEVQPEPLELRPYQEELAREGLQGKNVIIVAPTGSGKTHVALRVMENHLDQKGAGVRKVVFLVNQVALATQQYEACLKYLSRWRIKLVTGNAGVGSTEKVPLKHLVMRADILVMTAQILLNALGQKEVEGIGEFSMVVLDECHHTNLLHPFNSIMHGYMDIKYTNATNHDSPPQPLPQVVGLTASVGVGKAGNEDQAMKHIMKLCAHLDTDNICTVTQNTQELALYSNDPKYDQIICTKRTDDEFQEKIEDIMRTIETTMEKSKYLYSSGTEVLKDKLKLRPSVRGTVQYTGWVSELVKVIAMLDDAETRRYMDAARCMLKFYNETLVINDECDTQEALTFLERQLREYDPLGKRTTDMECFLQELFDKNLPYLSSLSHQQRDTNPKLITLEDVVLKEPAYEGRPKYYAAAPLAEGRDGGEAGRQREGTELDAEETERKYVLSSAPPKWSVRTTEGESDVEGDEDEFHSCDEGEEVPDFTQLKIRMAWNDPGCRDRGGNQPGQQVWENQESTPGRKEFREKNILPMDEMASSVDNSNEEWVDPAALEEVKEVQPEPLELRPYQEELAREGLQGKNVIIVAPTGSGKTHVALRVMENHLDQKGAGVRKVVFLVNQVALATQQYEACLKYLSRWRIKLVTGNAGVGSTEKVPLKHLVMRADILVMTAQILLNALGQKEVEGIGEFSMVVLDECHHTNLLHPFNSIMHGYMDIKYTNATNHDSPPQPLPQVVGLTASVGVGKAGNEDQAMKHIMKLCAHLDTDNICTVTQNTQELALYSNDPKYDQIICTKRTDDEFQEKIEDIMRTIETTMEKSKYLYSSGTEVLKDKLKLRPSVRGTVQYTGWVSELVKVIAMLDDAETRRYMDAARCMLKFYNETLVINDECDTQEALTFLERQLREYDPLGKRTTDMECFLQELFDKNLPYLSSLSHQQRDTNPKLITLEDVVLKVFREEPDSRAIVFVKTRDLALALLKWMLRRPDLKALKPGRMVGAGPCTDRGGMTKTQQVDVMEFFRSGDHKIMIATSVAEEGLDIRKCNLVIRYNHVSNEIAMVQARGRARAENSQFLTLASQNQGVQVKEEVNFIREMMMHEAIKKLQSEISRTPARFRSELDQIQREEKSKRDAELAARSGRQLHQGEVVFRCRKCNAYAFVSSDVRRIDGIHHVVVDLEYRDRNIERIYPPKEYGNIQVRGRVLCKDCGEDWGPLLLFQNCKFPGTRLEGFLLTDEHGRKDVPKKWKQVQFTVSDLQPEELTSYRQRAIAVDYIDLGD